jgi:uncharacterized protein YjiS (DUF1127 family)
MAANIRTVREGLVMLLWHLARQIDNWVAAANIRWERRAAIATLRRLSDRDLKDMGLRRSGIDAALAEAEETRTRWAQAARMI